MLAIAGRGRALPWKADTGTWQKSKKEGRERHHHARAPTSPVNGAGEITGCRDYAERPESFLPASNFFPTRLSDCGFPNRVASSRVVVPIANGARDRLPCHRFPKQFLARWRFRSRAARSNWHSAMTSPALGKPPRG